MRCLAWDKISFFESSFVFGLTVEVISCGSFHLNVITEWAVLCFAPTNSLRVHVLLVSVWFLERYFLIFIQIGRKNCFNPVLHNLIAWPNKMTAKTSRAAKSVWTKFASTYFPEAFKSSVLCTMVCTDRGLDPFFLFDKEAAAYVTLTIKWMFSEIFVAKQWSVASNTRVNQPTPVLTRLFLGNIRVDSL